MGSIIALVVLTIASVFFTTSMIALRTFSMPKLQEAFKNSGKEKHWEKLVGKGESLIFSCSLYTVICNLCFLLVLFRVISQAEVKIGTVYVLTFAIAAAVFSLLTLAIPHAWAKYAGEQTLSRTYFLLVFLSVPLTPLLYLFRLQNAIVRRLAGVSEVTAEEEKEEKQEEFLTDLEQHRMEGAVDEEEQEMIENVLELSDTSVDEIMTPRTDVIGVEVKDEREKVLETVKAAGHSRLPVYEENIDNIIGFIYAKDLLSEIGTQPEEFNLREKKREAYFVPETKPLRALLHEFQNQKLHIAVVLDEYGGTAGIITIEDILEELVGEITDEYEKIPPKPIKRIDGNTVDLDARTYIDDVNDELKLELPEDEDYDTIGGFVFSHLGYIPKTGEVFEYEKLKFTIISAEARRIKRLRIEKPAE
jgi:CBS domain containing-hemolysin-like protein